MIFSEVSSCKSEILFLKINLFILFIFVLFIQIFLFDLKLSRQETWSPSFCGIFVVLIDNLRQFHKIRFHSITILLCIGMASFIFGRLALTFNEEWLYLQIIWKTWN